MQAEIISVGTEIILGQITNTNARYLADQLRQLAIEAPWQTNVDDDPARIKQALATAKERANLIFICGGLGPTEDDRTMAAVGDYWGANYGSMKTTGNRSRPNWRPGRFPRP